MNVKFFVVGYGRSGSTWLARALDLDELVRVWHEPLHEFDRRFAPRLHGGMDAGEFLTRRTPLMERIAAGHSGQGYAEVNGYLSSCMPVLRRYFDVPVVGLIRDGRLTVRSTLIRKRQGQETGMTARYCRKWAETYWGLVLQGVPVFKLEALNEEYDYFHRLCKLVGVKVSEEDWRTVAGKPVNRAIVRQVKEFKWGDEHTRTFRDLAGDIQEAFGYSLEAL